MVWNGVPFPFVDVLTKDSIVLQITKLPTIMVDSGFPWESLLGAFIAGGIPAFIAWKTIKYNNDLIKRQVTLAAQQKKCDELRGIFADYISQLEVSVECIELTYDEYDGDRNKIPLEKVLEFKSDFYKIQYNLSLIILIIGLDNQFYKPLIALTDDIMNRIEIFFDDYINNSSSKMYSLVNDKNNLLELFNNILKEELDKI